MCLNGMFFSDSAGLRKLDCEGACRLLQWMYVLFFAEGFRDLCFFLPVHSVVILLFPMYLFLFLQRSVYPLDYTLFLFLLL